MSSYHYLDEGELPIEKMEQLIRISSPRFKKSLLKISLILSGAALLGIFLCIRAVFAQGLPTYTLFYEHSDIKAYYVGKKDHPWGTLHFPKGGGMFFKLDNRNQEVYFPEKTLSRNIVINKNYLRKKTVILLMVKRVKSGNFTSSFMFYSPDKLVMYMLK